MYTLYGSPGSGSAANEAALIVVGAEHRIVRSSTWEPGPGLDELATLNPMKQVPTLRLPEARGLFADTFEHRPFLCGAAPGASDLLAVVVSRWSGTRAHLRASRPAFTALRGRIEAHPPLMAVFKRH